MSAKDIERLAEVVRDELGDSIILDEGDDCEDGAMAKGFILVDGGVNPTAIVRALLQALREPTLEMIKEGSYQVGEYGDAKSTWLVMIDHLLSE